VKRLLLAVVLLLGFAATGQAQHSSAAGGTPTRPVAEVAAFGRQVEEALAAAGARVAFVGRLGRDPRDLPSGLRFTHVGLFAYATIRTVDGATQPGYAVYNLYQEPKNLNRSRLQQDFPLEFFADVHELRAGILIPGREVQARIGELLGSPTYAKLHNPNYSLVANPFAGKYQNCVTFMLDVLTAAIYRTDDLAALKANQRAWFQPTPIKVGGLSRALAVAFVPGIRDDDHRGEIRTATFESLAGFLTAFKLEDAAFELTPVGREPLRRN
jgi:hypothetical protein